MKIFAHRGGSKADRDTGTIRVNLEYKDIPHAYVGLNIKY